jgi:hypothetical protein
MFEVGTMQRFYRFGLKGMEEWSKLERMPLLNICKYLVS